MKKHSQKLALARETLAQLEPSHLPRVAAGISTPVGCTHPCPVSLSCPRIC
jgi:hypothetical protein